MFGCSAVELLDHLLHERAVAAGEAVPEGEADLRARCSLALAELAAAAAAAAGAGRAGGAAAAGGGERPRRRPPAAGPRKCRRLSGPWSVLRSLPMCPTFLAPGAAGAAVPTVGRCGRSRTRRSAPAPPWETRPMRGVVPAGRVQTPPQVQCRRRGWTAARNSCSPLAGSTRWLSRSQVGGRPAGRRPCRRRPAAVGERHAPCRTRSGPGVPDRHVGEAQEVVVVAGRRPGRPAGSCGRRRSPRSMVTLVSTV